MTAFATAVIFVGVSVVIRCLTLDLGTVRMLSRFTAHSSGMPSSGPISTSTGMPRATRHQQEPESPSSASVSPAPHLANIMHSILHKVNTSPGFSPVRPFPRTLVM